jgi:hypothetical protein
VTKRQREQAKRDRKAEKAERRAQRKADPGSPESEFEYQHPDPDQPELAPES